MTPFEVLAGPLTLWLAPVGEAFPLIDADPAGNWVKVGTSGDRNYEDDGITVTHSQNISTPRGAGSTGPLKALRSEEDLMIAVTLWDLSLEAYSLALNSNTVTTTAAGSGTAGFKSLDLYRGGTVSDVALLARGKSPYAADMNMQFEIPRCFQSGDPEPQFKKDVPAGLLLQYTALIDTTASAGKEFGQLLAQHQDALP